MRVERLGDPKLQAREVAGELAPRDRGRPQVLREMVAQAVERIAAGRVGRDIVRHELSEALPSQEVRDARIVRLERVAQPDQVHVAVDPDALGGRERARGENEAPRLRKRNLGLCRPGRDRLFVRAGRHDHGLHPALDAVESDATCHTPSPARLA